MTIETEAFYNKLITHECDFFTGVPDSLLSSLCWYIQENAPSANHVIAANEGNALSMAAGYHVATGKFGVVYLQNSGEGNIVNPYLSLVGPDVYDIPALLIIGWRGEPGTADEPEHTAQGMLTCKLLETLGIHYFVLDDSWESQVDNAMTTMRREHCLVALVIRKGTFSPIQAQAMSYETPLMREEALRAVLGELGPEDFTVATVGKTGREIFEIREERGEGHTHDFLAIGGMGHTSSFALGLAKGTDKNIWCIDGDGAFLMHMGSVATFAQNAPDNLKYILNSNGAHDSVGGLPTIASKLDLENILRGMGFQTVMHATTAQQVAERTKLLSSTPHAALIVETRPGARADLGRPTLTPREALEGFEQSVRSPKELHS